MIPEELLYTESHEWVRIEDNLAIVGITHYAQEQLGDLTFIELPAPGALVEAGQEMGTVESVKAASEIYSPVTGEVLEINEELENSPELVNDEPYEKGWMIKVSLSQDPEGLLTAESYKKLLESEEH